MTRDGGFAEHAVVATDKLRPIGDLPFHVAALAEPLACVLNGLRQAGTDRVERALVLGAGPIGLLMALALRGRGVAHVALAERDDARLAFAEGLGFAVHPAGSGALARERHGFDLVVEATGAAPVAEGALEHAADGGAVLIFGVASRDARIAVSPFEVFRRQLRLVGSHSLNGYIDEALDLLRASPDVFARLVSERVPLRDVAAFLTGEARARIKVQFEAPQ